MQQGAEGEYGEHRGRQRPQSRLGSAPGEGKSGQGEDEISEIHRLLEQIAWEARIERGSQ